MRFWDTSALVPLLVRETGTARVRPLYDQGVGVVVWWGTEVECASAVARRERAGALSPGQATELMKRLDVLAASWSEVAPSAPVRRRARRLLRTHELRAADALQLAAALVLRRAAGDLELELVTLDDRLGTAAAREGFEVVPG